ncbi:PRC-barrel domain-containing protein [Nereida sp. MMG025]|uniref:PRC-barrel domain-containing protein n=1 Tax=Nereida sp. MMG025 TaxID=2909981 RepID=UPI001F329B69|nr:PRC-barrel domain-containing protein [Nereida sp. MMG025]MCF6444919.1 PRC-barrel domain-containing protein [Nereida sp. MMG025]
MKFLTTTAIALGLTATAAIADTPSNMSLTGENSAQMSVDPDALIRTRDITGGSIYAMEVVQPDAWFDGDDIAEFNPEWNEIGEIEDIVLSKDGQMTGIVAEVGGFLDIGDKHVLISLDDVKLVPVDDETYAYVTYFSEEQLEEMDSVDEGFWN